MQRPSQRFVLRAVGRIALVAVLALPLGAALLAADPVRSAFAQEAAEAASPPELPVVYEGDGLRVIIETLDQESGRTSGTLVLGELRMPFDAVVKESESGEGIVVGVAETSAGKLDLYAVEESATVAVVKLGGRSYRTTLVERKATDPAPGAKPEPKDAGGAPPSSSRTPSSPSPPAPTAGSGAKPAATPATKPGAAPSPAADPARPRPTGRVVMKLHTLTDKGSGGMQSHTVLAPAGWTVEGGAWWPAPAFFRILPSQDIKVTAPDGRMVHVGPSIGATDFLPSDYAASQLGGKRPQEGTASEGYPVLYMPANLDEWKTFIADKAIRTAYPKATNVRVERVVPIPELTAILQRQLEPIKQQNAAANERSRALGVGTFSFSDGAVLGASTTFELDGKSWEQLNVFGVMHTGLDTQVGRQLWWGIEPSVAFLAPAGKLEESLPLLMSISYSVRMTPAWAKMKSDHMAKMNQIDAKGAADRAQIWADSNREVSRIINDGYRERSASSDETHRKFINSIRGVEDYTTSAGGTSVQLPNEYSYVYGNGNGEYILTNEAGYDPNADKGVNNTTWETMKAAGK